MINSCRASFLAIIATFQLTRPCDYRNISPYRSTTQRMEKPTMTYKIRKDIPMPVGGQNAPAYPLRQMAVGDSFDVPANKQGGVRNCISQNRDRKFITRTVDVDGVRVLRVWRLS